MDSLNYRYHLLTLFFVSKNFQKSFSCINLVGKCGPACYPPSVIRDLFVCASSGQRVSSGENQPGPHFLTGVTKSTYITSEGEM